MFRLLAAFHRAVLEAEAFVVGPRCVAVVGEALGDGASLAGDPFLFRSAAVESRGGAEDLPQLADPRLTLDDTSATARIDSPMDSVVETTA